jgi:hypothetical protein
MGAVPVNGPPFGNFGPLPVPRRVQHFCNDILPEAERSGLDLDYMSFYVRPSVWLGANFTPSILVLLCDCVCIGNLSAPEGYVLVANEPFLMSVPAFYKEALVAVVSERGQVEACHSSDTTVFYAARRLGARVLAEALAAVGCDEMHVARYGMKLPLTDAAMLFEGVDWSQECSIDIGQRYRVPGVVLCSQAANAPTVGLKTWPMFNCAGVGSLAVNKAFQRQIPWTWGDLELDKAVVYSEVVHCLKIGKATFLSRKPIKGRQLRVTIKDNIPRLFRVTGPMLEYGLGNGLRVEMRLVVHNPNGLQQIPSLWEQVEEALGRCVSCHVVPAQMVAAYMCKTYNLMRERKCFRLIQDDNEVSARHYQAWAYLCNSAGFSSSDIKRFLRTPEQMDRLFPEHPEPVQYVPVPPVIVPGLLPPAIPEEQAALLVKRTIMRYLYVRCSLNQGAGGENQYISAAGVNGGVRLQRAADTPEGKRELVDRVYAAAGAAWEAEFMSKRNGRAPPPRLPRTYHLVVY